MSPVTAGALAALSAVLGVLLLVSVYRGRRPGLVERVAPYVHQRQVTSTLLTAAPVAVEAVYAVFEVKQEANKRFMDYAGRKIASVRCLHRTSITIPHAGGVFAPKKPIHILGGLLTTRSGWVDLDGKVAVESIMRLTGDFRIDIGCALGARSFNNPYSDSSKLEYSDSNTALLFFLFKLFSRLQGLGTVAAMDIGEYVNFISRENSFAGKTYDPGCDQE